MTTMTVTDALAELTLLEKRIESARIALDKNTLITVIGIGKVPTGYQSRDEYASQARASLQRVNDLINRRRSIKRSIVLSNAATIVTVAGEEMTVAEAIEMKSFVKSYESVLATVKNTYQKASKNYTDVQHQIKERLDTLAIQVLGRAEAINPDQYQNQYQILSDSFMAREGVELLDPVNLAREIERREAFIEDFKSSVDRVLSVSNARTMIEIPD
jgi:hypothetical protein